MLRLDSDDPHQMNTSLRRRWSVRLSLLLAITLLGIALWAAGTRRGPALSLLVITLDTTRADRLVPYGLMDVSMPSLARLAREGIVFDQAIAVSPLTLPAHCSLFTGLRPPGHRVRDNADPPLGTAHTTLAEVLRAQGFRTAAFVASTVLDPERGLAQGFDTYSGVPLEGARVGGVHQRRAPDVVGETARWLERVGGSRFFAWAHLYDPHRPYDPPEPFQSATPDPYIGEVAFADSQIGRLLATLETQGLLDRTIVAVVGDHGESLGEHGESDHGIFLYEGVLRVPLMIRVPGGPTGRVPEVVRLTDVMPTVLELAGVTVPPVDGVSLVDLMTGRRRGLELEGYSESLYPRRFGWSALYALRDNRYKFIDAPKPELYDLVRDPFEERNIIEERPGVAAAMKRRLASLTAKGSTDVAAESVEASAETRERLAALGYVAAARVGVPSTGTLPDPKDCLPRTGSPSPGINSCRDARK